MDLSKAKYVIIALLLAFNSFLLYNNLSYFNNRGVRKETISNAVSILKTRGITLDCSLPASMVKIRRLVYGNKKLDRAAITNKLTGSSGSADSGGNSGIGSVKLTFSNDTAFVYTDSNPRSHVNTSNMDEAAKYARKFLENAGLLDGKYVVDSTVRNQDGSITVVFIQKYDRYLVFDNYCAVTLNNSGISRIEYSKLQIIGFSPESVAEVAEYQVLLAHYQEGSGQVISSMDIGYKYPEGQLQEDVETSELTPVLRVKMKGTGQVDYLNMVYTSKDTPAAVMSATTVE